MSNSEMFAGMTKPPRDMTIVLEGHRLTLREWSNKTGIPSTVLFDKLKRWLVARSDLPSPKPPSKIADWLSA